MSLNVKVGLIGKLDMLKFKNYIHTLDRYCYFFQHPLHKLHLHNFHTL